RVRLGLREIGSCPPPLSQIAQRDEAGNAADDARLVEQRCMPWSTQTPGDCGCGFSNPRQECGVGAPPGSSRRRLRCRQGLTCTRLGRDGGYRPMTASPMTARGNFSPALYWEGAGANEPIRRAHDGRLGPSLTRARHGSCRSAHPLDLSTKTSECMVQRLLLFPQPICSENRRLNESAYGCLASVVSL